MKMPLSTKYNGPLKAENKKMFCSPSSILKYYFINEYYYKKEDMVFIVVSKHKILSKCVCHYNFFY